MVTSVFTHSNVLTPYLTKLLACRGDRPAFISFTHTRRRAQRESRHCGCVPLPPSQQPLPPSPRPHAPRPRGVADGAGRARAARCARQDAGAKLNKEKRTDRGRRREGKHAAGNTQYSMRMVAQVTFPSDSGLPTGRVPLVAPLTATDRH